MAQSDALRGYPPARYPQIPGGEQKFVTDQLQQIAISIATLVQVVKQIDAGRSNPVAFSTLPAAAASLEGLRYPVNDSTTAVWGATITGGGANHVLAYCNGTAWTVAAK